ncbi:MAG: hypothetical protein ABSB40_11585 [Nitrososphaeria archaeon]
MSIILIFEAINVSRICSGHHSAGADLTDAPEDAPHDGAVLEKFPVIGTLRGTSST